MAARFSCQNGSLGWPDGLVFINIQFNSTAKTLIHGLALLLALTCPSLPAQPVPDTKPVLRLRILGGLAGLNQYTRLEQPFWSRELAQLSHGKYSADITPFDKAGVPGGDMLRLLKLGVVPFGTTLVSSMAQQHPQFTAMDLAGLNPDMASLKKNVAAFRPYLENELRSHHNIQMLALYTYPAQVLFCKQPFSRLTDLKGRRIRASSTTQSDFIRAIGALPVMTGFAQIMDNIASGNIDCAITGTMSGNTLGLHEASRHISSMPITWGLAVFAANINAWAALPPDLRALISRELPRLETKVWTESEAGLNWLPDADLPLPHPGRSIAVCPGHLLQTGNSFRHGWMGGEQRHQPASGQRINDKHVRGCRTGLLHGNLAVAHFQLLQGIGQGKRLAANCGSARIRPEFTGAGDGHLHQHGCQGRQNCHGNQTKHTAPLVIITAAAEHRPPLGHVGQIGNRPGKGGGNGLDQNIAVFDMGQFMGHDPGQLVVAQNAQNAAGGGHCGMLGVAAGGKGVGGIGVNHIHPGHG